MDNTKLDLMKRVKMLEFALRQERQVDMFFFKGWLTTPSG